MCVQSISKNTGINADDNFLFPQHIIDYTDLKYADRMTPYLGIICTFRSLKSLKIPVIIIFLRIQNVTQIRGKRKVPVTNYSPSLIVLSALGTENSEKYMSSLHTAMVIYSYLIISFFFLVVKQSSFKQQSFKMKDIKKCHTIMPCSQYFHYIDIQHKLWSQRYILVEHTCIHYILVEVIQ